MCCSLQRSGRFHQSHSDETPNRNNFTGATGAHRCRSPVQEEALPGGSEPDNHPEDQGSSGGDGAASISDHLVLQLSCQTRGGARWST